MSAAYPIHLEREIDRRWLHRFMSIDRPMPLDRPKHPNDICPLPERPNNQTSPLRKSEPSQGDPDKVKAVSWGARQASDGILIGSCVSRRPSLRPCLAY
jgi:hypothetical protein